MTLTEKIIFGAVVVAVSLGASWYFFGSQNPSSFGATAGSLLAEHYIPYVSTNQGYDSALPIQTTDSLVGGNVSSTGTSTFADTVNFTNPAICINLYATSSATQLHIVASTTPTLPNGAAAVLTLQYGACAN